MSLPWRLDCPWCDYFIWVVTRGSEAGVEAAEMMQTHVCTHGRTWIEFVTRTKDRGSTGRPASIEGAGRL